MIHPHLIVKFDAQLFKNYNEQSLRYIAVLPVLVCYNLKL